jgi:putative membrane protein
VGLLSIPPTLAFRRWRRAAPDEAAVGGVRRLLRLEVGLLLLIPVFAALMARYQG